MAQIKFKLKMLDVDEFLQKIFGTVPTEKIKLNFETLRKYAAETKSFEDAKLTELDAVNDISALENFINHPKTQIKAVKDLVKACLTNNGTAFDEGNLNYCMKPAVAAIFKHMFEFDGSGAPTPAAKKSSPSVAKTSPTASIDVTFEMMRRILDKCLIKPTMLKEPPKAIDVTEFTMTENLPITLLNDVYMQVPNDISLCNDAMAIVIPGAPYELAAVGSLQKNDDKMHILLKVKNIVYDVFRRQKNFCIVLLPDSANDILARGDEYDGDVYRIECEITFAQLKPAKSTLCIDFGTSNTTVGTYGVKNPGGSEPEIVEFIDETSEQRERRPMIPTIVYVDSCKNGVMKYSFGYEALKKVIEKDYNPKAAVFYELKRWINDLSGVEELNDEFGNTSTATHRDIMTAYLKYILELSEQYFERRFEKLHFTAPVKLKDSFIEAMTNIFGDRTVFGSDMSIDEGIAIIYNHIAEQLADKKKRDELTQKSKTVLIMDCGGGTTDLAGCTYSLTTGYSKILHIRTKFENGDSNFGGNNVTFRILQLLKIKLANQLKRKNDPELDEDLSIQTLLDDETSMLDVIDNEPNYDAYAAFNAAYEEAEAWVPTQFAKTKMRNQKGQFKRNFYYLWQMAEAYKIQFYRASMDFVSVDFNDAEDRKLGIPDDDKYYLFVRESENGELIEKRNPMSGIKVTNNDIHRLLYADIYTLLKTVLYSYDVNDDEQELLKYNHYKLSGQSCKITLFNELLKEFIPGKYLRYGDKKNVSPDSSELKLACIKGSICYRYDTEYGEIKPQIEMDTPKLIYNVCKLDKYGEEKLVMLDRTKLEVVPDVGNISGMKLKIEPEIDILASSANRATYAVISQNGKIQNRIDFDFNCQKGRQLTSLELEEDISKRTYDAAKDLGKFLVQKLVAINLDNEGEVFTVFAVPSKNGYGIYIYCVKKALEEGRKRYYLQQEPKYYGFENNKLDTFFDGNR